MPHLKIYPNGAGEYLLFRRLAGEMRMNMAKKRVLTEAQAGKYRGLARRKDRGRVLDDLVKLTRYNRHYAAWLLRNYGRRRLVRAADGRMVRLVVGRRNRRRASARACRYDERVRELLVLVWDTFDQMCGKRLAAILPAVLPTMGKHRLISRREPACEKLLQLSAATIDRLLRPERAARRLKGIGHTKPSTALKNTIPIATSSEVERGEPGHFQIDLVGHEGGNPNGQFAFTLSAVDLYSGWFEPWPLLNKAHRWAKEALQRLKEASPVALKSLHSDSDCAFINEPVQRWAREATVPYRRGRPYHSNDTCWVEQKNFAIVRCAVGYARYETDQEVALLRALYGKLRLLVNFFYPSVKLLEKRRVNGKIRRRYDRPTTPAQRLLSCAAVSPASKRALRRQLQSLDPIELKKQITAIQRKLLRLVRSKGMTILNPGPAYPKATERMSLQLFGHP
jgi:hypothetical protein